MNTTHQAIHPTGHTMRDAEALEAAGINPADRQPREWTAVTCGVCGAATRHLSDTCDRHYQPPAATLLADSAREFARITIS